MKLYVKYLYEKQLLEVDILNLISKHGIQKTKEIIKKARKKSKYIYPDRYKED